MILQVSLSVLLPCDSSLCFGRLHHILLSFLPQINRGILELISLGLCVFKMHFLNERN
jgi:hypothetical protein